MRREPLAAFMTVFLVLLIVAAFLAPLLAPHDPLQQDLTNVLAAPSGTHWFGTDDLGRDVFSRMLYGAQVSLTAAFLAVGAAVLLAVPIGLVAGYRGGRTDAVIMRLLDIQLALPGLVLVIAVASALGGGTVNTMLALAIAFVPGLARVVRGETLAVREEPYIEASRAIGTPSMRILRTRVLRNVSPPLLVQVAITCGQAMGLEAALSFIGLGAQAPEASWGSILRRAYDSIFIAPAAVLVPAAFITLTAWAFNALGDALGNQLSLNGRTARKGTRALTLSQTTGSGIRPQSAGVLDVSELTVAVDTDRRRVLVEDVALTVGRGRVTGIVGESGSGKTVTAMTLTRLMASPPAVVTAGSVRICGDEILAMPAGQLADVRGRVVSMIFQNPKASLNPALTIGRQITEVLQWHGAMGRGAARAEAERLLERVGVPADRARAYPHQLSGGMCQRVMVAMAVACRPQLLIADEPTSALDVTVQAEILDLLHELAEEGMAIVLITHDFGVVADICDDVVVMYAGEVIEQGPVVEVLDRPGHPYTAALLNALPARVPRGEPLAAIEGRVPAAGTRIVGCRFAERCAYAVDACRSAPIPLDASSTGDRQARCIRSDELLGARVLEPESEKV
ncbi:dipeptide/oligopeptide/nickel ABC transporter permease/ATP-binding protein [Saccharomonospora sp. NPDC046836]|uniref:dipeptide/oligopeptide/nickel ABC transporter permease/ATP-binding protein n=1 Tax=Saccharomonospora sp. NPDC046836 TaxID=3156921 RepID=UPI0033D5D4D0